MNARIKRPLDRSGFTLVEVIATILAAAVLGTIFINFMGTAMSKSSLAVERVRDEAGGEAVIEAIVADYVYELNRDPAGALNTINSRSYDTDHVTVTKNYVNFDTGGNEIILPLGDTSNNLKIRADSTGRVLTTLLTRSRLAGSPAVTY